MSGTLPWYIARSAGLVAWALLSASVIWGLTMSNRTRPFGHRPRPAWMLDLHRWLGGLATIFVGVHIVAILLDSYVNFSIVSVLVPFTAAWRTSAVAWGVVAMWLLLAVELTSLARRRLPRRAWRLVHGASFPLFGLATLHAFTAGTDAGSLLFIGAAVPVILIIAVLTARRILEVTAEAPPSQSAPERSTPERSACPQTAASALRQSAMPDSPPLARR
jgi:methionine sulfoxide reductase heme-binding subunit